MKVAFETPYEYHRCLRLKYFYLYSFSNIRVDLYEGITELEARSIANRHNAKLRSLDITFQVSV